MANTHFDTDLEKYLDDIEVSLESFVETYPFSQHIKRLSRLNIELIVLNPKLTNTLLVLMIDLPDFKEAENLVLKSLDHYGGILVIDFFEYHQLESTLLAHPFSDYRKVSISKWMDIPLLKSFIRQYNKSLDRHKHRFHKLRVKHDGMPIIPAIFGQYQSLLQSICDLNIRNVSVESCCILVVDRINQKGNIVSMNSKGLIDVSNFPWTGINTLGVQSILNQGLPLQFESDTTASYIESCKFGSEIEINNVILVSSLDDQLDQIYLLFSLQTGVDIYQKELLHFVSLKTNHLFECFKLISEIQGVRTQNSRFLQLIDKSPLGAIEFDREGRVLHWNDSATNIFGYTSDKMIGTVPSMILAKDSLNDIESQWDNYFESLEVPILHLDHIDQEGKIVKCIWYNSIVKNDSGDMTGIYSLIEDVTEKEEMLHELEKAHKQLNEITTYFPGVTFQFEARADMNWKVVFASRNTFELLGYDSNQDSLFEIFMQMALPQYQDELFLSILKSVEGKIPWFFEGEFKHGNGSNIWLSCRSVPIEIKPDVTLFNGIILDVTNLKEAELEVKNARIKAEELSALKSNLLSTISHEIRTPLNGIIGLSDVLLMQPLDEVTLDYLSEIRKSGDRLLDTLDTVFQLAYLKNNEIKLEISSFYLETFLESERKYFEQQAYEKGLILKNTYKGDIIIEHDKRFIGLALRQLIGNAIKYTPTGSVTIAASTDNDKLTIEVKDTGIGIDKEHYDLIFEEFRQVSEGHSRLFEGIGLGLSIAKKAMDAIHGHIKVYSPSKQGSVFTMYIPLLK